MQSTTYDPVAKILHWLIAALLVWQYVIAWQMPHIGRNTPNEGLVNQHLSVGALTLLVVVVRLAWRATHPVPPPAEATLWQRRAAAVVHWLLYAFLILNPLMGWANASYRGFQVSLFDLVPLPALVEKGNALGRAMGDIHAQLGWYALILIGLHILAALYHFARRDGVLERMLPTR
jgi:cytochrome b561